LIAVFGDRLQNTSCPNAPSFSQVLPGFRSQSVRRRSRCGDTVVLLGMQTATTTAAATAFDGLMPVGSFAETEPRLTAFDAGSSRDRTGRSIERTSAVR
jgi:hypothetical protein